MDVGMFLGSLPTWWSPVTFAVLVVCATLMVWMSFAPARPAQAVQKRLSAYLDPHALDEGSAMRGSFASRALGPFFRRLLGLLGTLAPKRNMEMTRQMLLQAGEPGGLSALDFLGLRLLAVVVAACGIYLLSGGRGSSLEALRNVLIAGVLGYLLPVFWLRSRVRNRQHQILKALPDALDMLTIGVEAGLAFESALARVGAKWDNALTRELRRAVAEMRIGTPRDVALQRVAERTGVSELNTFVAVLIQSTQLGVSIAQVLHSQAAEMRLKRRQRVEETARQASVKMVFPLVFLLFPSMFVVVFGPAIPVALAWIARVQAGTHVP